MHPTKNNSGVSGGGELDAEGGAFAELGVFDVDFAAVVVFDDALHEREPESPATFFLWCSPAKTRFLKFLRAMPFPVSATSIHTFPFSVPVVIVSKPSPPMASTAFFVRFSITHSKSGAESSTPWSSSERLSEILTLPDMRLLIY